MSIESRDKFPCSSCDAVLLSRKALHNHHQIFHSDVIEQHPCECGKVFLTKGKLYQHRSTVHNENESYPCSSCSRVFRHKSNLGKHRIKEHSKKAPCGICDKLFAPGMFMSRHLKTHGPKKVKCPYRDCSKAFSCNSWLKTHIETHETHEASFTNICPICNASFSSLRNLNRHVARQHNSLRIQCEVEGCNHSTARKDILKAHYRSHKDIDEETRTVLLEKTKSIKAISW